MNSQVNKLLKKFVVRGVSSVSGELNRSLSHLFALGMVCVGLI